LTLRAAHRGSDAAARLPSPLGALPAAVDPGELTAALRLDLDPWLLPVGIGERDLEPAVLRMHPG
jgi:hypothetical protein